jgi:threonine efflux protein
MLTTLLTLWLLHATLLLSPGANTLLITQLAASSSLRAAVFAALGVGAGATMWAILAVLGVNAVFAAFPHVRFALQIAGGLYLLSIAWRLWRSSAKSMDASAPSVAPAVAFRMGLLTNVTNPKSALFYGSMISSTLAADAHPLLPVLAVAMLGLNSTLWHLGLAFALSRAHIRAAYARSRRVCDRVASVCAGAFGARMLWGTLREAQH